MVWYKTKKLQILLPNNWISGENNQPSIHIK